MNRKVPFTVLALIEAKPGKEKALHDTLQSLIAPTLQEEGCLSYELYQCNDNPAKFMFHENWETQPTHANHRTSPHMKTWRAKKEELLIAPSDVTSWKRIG